MTTDSDQAAILDLDVDLSQHLDELELDESDDDDEPVLRWKDGRTRRHLAGGLSLRGANAPGRVRGRSSASCRSSC